MSVMRFRSERADRLVAALETSCGSGDFKVDERLRVEEVCQGTDRSFSTATISVRVDDAFDSEEARRRYHPDQRIVVMTDEADSSKREILFEGYPPVQTSRWDGRIGREDERYVFEAEHVFERLGRAREAMVYGRRIRNGTITDGLVSEPDVFAGESALMTALPCVFNPDGVANRAATPLTVQGPGGQSRLVHLFTWEGSWTARKWTYATILRYLLWFHLLPEGPVFEGNTFTTTDALASDAASDADLLTQALGREPASLNCEATSLVEALSLWSEASGIHVTAETVNVDNRPMTQLRLWSSQGGALRQLYLVRGGHHSDGTARYDTAGRSVREILSGNNIYRGQVTWDHRDIVNAPVVIGDIKRYEMTIPLWPGWVPRDDLDNVAPGDRPAAKVLALTPEQVEALGDDAEDYNFFRRYHRLGSEFKLDEETSRLWVLNEDGYYSGALYNRNAPFDDYQPFDFSGVSDETVTRVGAWMRRPRRLLPAISTSTGGRSLGVWVEISFDSGATWHQQAGGVRILEDRVGVYFECENPAEITPAGTNPNDQNMWYAIIDQTFRVRVTAVVESDERLLATYPIDQLASPTLHANAMVVRRPTSFRFATRSHTTNVLVSGTVAGAGERDDTEAIEALTEQLAQENQDRKVRVAPVIPWIETGYAIGDRITEIRGRHLRFDTVLGADKRYPSVIGRRFLLYDGRYETELTLGMTDVSGSGM